MENSTTTCVFSDARWIQKSGEIRTLEPLGTAGSNANFQFQKMDCVGNATSTASVSNDGILTGTFFIILLAFLFFQFFIFKFIGIKVK